MVCSRSSLFFVDSRNLGEHLDCVTITLTIGQVECHRNARLAGTDQCLIGQTTKESVIRSFVDGQEEVSNVAFIGTVAFDLGRQNGARSLFRVQVQ